MLYLSSSPHLKSKLNTRKVMHNVLIGLLPPSLAAVWFFKIQAAILIFTSVISCFLADVLVAYLRKRKYRYDGSSIVTGLLFALLLPPKTSLYAAIIGSFFAIIVVKELFGGIGYNIFNPALMARAFLMAAYPVMFTSFNAPFSLDSVSNATPLVLRKFSFLFTPLAKLFLGTTAGSLGETSSLCIIIGGVYLLIRKIADWRLPLAMTLSLVFFSSIFYFFNHQYGSPLFHLFAGGFMLGVFFMATDPVTTPTTKLGRYIFGAICGLLILIIRYFAGVPEGVMYSILFMNAFVPLINNYTKPRSFGE